MVPRLLEDICRLTGMSYSAIARVTPEQWTTCATHNMDSLGIKKGDQLNTRDTISREVLEKRKSIAVDHLEKDLKYKECAAPLQYGIQSCVSVPIFYRNGIFFGTLSAADSRPAKNKAADSIPTLNLFSELISLNLDKIEEAAHTKKIQEEKHMASEIREEFISILGHDLRNPIATARMSSEILLKLSDNEMIARHARMIKGTTFRIEGMVENIVEFARSKAGTGLKLTMENDLPALEKDIEQVFKEFQLVNPERDIEFETDIREDMHCDSGRLCLLLANLLEYAEVHSASESSIRSSTISDPAEFRISVAYSGEPIPEALIPHLFDPYFQGDPQAEKKELGLNLYVAAEIAKAHGGNLSVKSREEETIFSFRMDLKNS